MRKYIKLKHENYLLHMWQTPFYCIFEAWYIILWYLLHNDFDIVVYLLSGKHNMDCIRKVTDKYTDWFNNTAACLEAVANSTAVKPIHIITGLIQVLFKYD